ncbi:MAG: hypothetical protein QXL96_07955 [Ignisphaera sp.]
MKALPESSDDHGALVEFLRLYRDAVQFVVNKLWSLSKVPCEAVSFFIFVRIS